jgi:acetyl-CoA carboxylase biotin carboxyl carrier protein
MSTNFDKLKEFINLARETGAMELEFSQGEEAYRIAFASATHGVQHVLAPSAPMPVAAQAAGAPAALKSNYLEIKSPFVGTYYKSPSPSAAAYVKPGDKISKGKVLCIIEAMKIMNEIESEISGEIVEICVENESFVEFGQVLFRVKPN